MNSPPYTPIPVTEAEYLAFELTTEIRHEFIGGDVLARTGESEAHNLINVNVLVTLGNQLEKRECLIYLSQMRLKVEATGMFAYPDQCIVCGKSQFVEGIFDTLTNPTVLVEIPSRFTEVFDRGVKFRNYRQLPSLQEYLLITQERAHIEHYIRRDDNTWILTDIKGLDSALILPSINCTLLLSDVYRRVTFKVDEADS